MRVLFFVLVLANLVFLAWAQGYLGGGDENREPQRMAQQLNPEKLKLVREAAAPAAKREESACRMIDGLAPPEGEALKAALLAAAMEAKLAPVSAGTRQLVVVPDLANRAAAEKKSAELGRLGVQGQQVAERDGGHFEVVLGSFATEPAAREYLQGLTKRGVKSARVEAREAPALKVRIEARGGAATLLQQLPKLIAPYADASIGDCAP